MSKYYQSEMESGRKRNQIKGASKECFVSLKSYSKKQLLAVADLIEIEIPPSLPRL